MSESGRRRDTDQNENEYRHFGYETSTAILVMRGCVTTAEDHLDDSRFERTPESQTICTRMRSRRK